MLLPRAVVVSVAVGGPADSYMHTDRLERGQGYSTYRTMHTLDF